MPPRPRTWNQSNQSHYSNEMPPRPGRERRPAPARHHDDTGRCRHGRRSKGPRLRPTTTAPSSPRRSIQSPPTCSGPRLRPTTTTRFSSCRSIVLHQVDLHDEASRVVWDGEGVLHGGDDARLVDAAFVADVAVVAPAVRAGRVLPGRPVRADEGVEVGGPVPVALTRALA